MKNPYIFWTVFAIVLIGGLFLGNSTWAKGITHGKSGTGTGTGNNPPAEGSECTLPNGVKGTIQGGICTGGRPPAGTEEQRAGLGANIPNLILVPFAADCGRKYTAQNPYKYGGCSYVFVQNIRQNGIAYCQLKKVSCP